MLNAPLSQMMCFAWCFGTRDGQKMPHIFVSSFIDSDVCQRLLKWQLKKHLIVYLEFPIMAKQLMPLSAISDLYVSAEMGKKQIWEEVDIQITLLTNISQWEQACLLKVSVWPVHSGAFISRFHSFFCLDTGPWPSSTQRRGLIQALQMNFN